MPYRSAQAIPTRIKNILPPYAQHIYQGAFNGAWNQYNRQPSEKREETAHRVAWTAVKKVYEKNKEGKWVLKDQKKKRTPEEVIESHLQFRKNGKVKENIEENYSKKCIILTSKGVFRRHTGAKKSVALLEKDLPHAVYTFTNVTCIDSIGFLEWAAQGPDGVILDGADTFIIENGEILYQTIHYTVTRKT